MVGDELVFDPTTELLALVPIHMKDEDICRFRER
jgi:hypothetical protein